MNLASKKLLTIAPASILKTDIPIANMPPIYEITSNMVQIIL